MIQFRMISASVIMVVVVSITGFLALASEPSAKGLVIEFGWDIPTIPWLCDNADMVECAVPFDGIIIDLARRPGQAGLSRHVWVGDAISSDYQRTAEEDIVLLNETYFSRLRENSFFREN